MDQIRKFSLLILITITLQGCGATPRLLGGDYYMMGDSSCKKYRLIGPTRIMCMNSSGEDMGYRDAMTAHQMHEYKQDKKELAAAMQEFADAAEELNQTVNNSVPAYQPMNLPDIPDLQIRQSRPSSYNSTTGNSYQYDLSNPADQVLYNADPAAQLRDRINPTVDIDSSLGQHGGGVYDNTSMECYSTDDCSNGQSCRSKSGGGAECR